MSQTVFIPSMRKNFVTADWFTGTSQIPSLKFPLILFWIIFNLWIQTFSLLFINEKTCFLYMNKPQHDYGVPFFQNGFTKEGMSALMQLLTSWFNSQNSLVKAKSCDLSIRLRLFFASLFFVGSSYSLQNCSKKY